MRLRFVLRLGWNDVRRTVKSRATFFWMLVLPLVFMWFFGQLGRDRGAPVKISLAVEDRDGGWLARAFVDDLADERLKLVKGEAAEGNDSGETDKPARKLVIPAGFTAGVLAGEQQVLELQNTPDADQEFSFAAQVHLVRAIVRVLARLVELNAAPTGIPEDAAAAGAAFAELGDRPRLVELAVSTAGSGRAVPSGFSQSVPGVLTMIVLMMTLIYGGVFLTAEKREGMLQRQLTLPLRRSEVFLGKLAGRLFIAGLQIVVLLVAARLLFDQPLGRSPLGLGIVLLSFAIAVAGLATLLGAVLRTEEQASSVGWISALVLAGLGGCWWPLEVVPPWLRTAAHVVPTTWAMDAFHALISFGRGVEAVLLPSAVLVAFGVVASWLGARSLRAER